MPPITDREARNLQEVARLLASQLGLDREGERAVLSALGEAWASARRKAIEEQRLLLPKEIRMADSKTIDDLAEMLGKIGGDVASVKETVDKHAVDISELKKAETKGLWRLFGAMAGVGGLLLIPSIGWLWQGGRLEQKLETIGVQVQETRDTSVELQHAAAAGEVENARLQERLRVLERVNRVNREPD